MKAQCLKFAVFVLIVAGVAFAQQPVNVANVPHVIVNTAPTTAVTESGTWNVNATLAAETTKVIGTVNVAAAQSIGVTGTFWQATQPVSGTFWQTTQPVSGTFYQATQPISGSVTATQATGTNLHVVVDTAPSTAVTGTFWQATQPVSGTFWQATQPVSVADAGNVTLGAKADAKSTATDTTAITAMQVLKEISAMEQAPASRAVTNAGTFETQPDSTTATTTNTALRCTLVSAASNNATVCKASAGNVYAFRFVNTTATLYYLRMYNLTSGPTCTSATGFIETIPIPASATGAGIVAIEPMGEGYSTGISFCFTGGSSSTDNSNAATGVFGSILYK